MHIFPRTSGILFALAVGVACTGCGGRGGGGGHSSESASQAIAQGTNDLNAALTQPSNRAADVQSAYTQLAYAITKDPTNPQAALGASIASSALVADAISKAFGSSLLSSSQALPLKRALNQMSLFSDTPLNAPQISTIDDVYPLRWAFSLSQTRGNGISVSKILSTLGNLLNALGKINYWLSDSTVASLETNPISYTILTKTGQKKSVKIGSVEALCLRASVRSLTSLIYLTFSYNLDPGSFDFTGNALASLTNNAGTLTPAQILPTGTFGQLTIGGATDLGKFPYEMRQGLTDIQSAVTAYNARKGSTGWLANEFNLTAAELTYASTFVTTYMPFLSSPQTVKIQLADGSIISTKINLSAWATKAPPTDLRSLMASIHSDGSKVTPVSGSIADPTFGGLFPQGLPTEALYGRTDTLVTGKTYSFADAAKLSGMFFSVPKL